MHSSDFSTANVSSRECFSYWREAVCQAILQVDAEVESRHGFKAAISGAVVGGAKLASFDSKPHRIIRTKSHVSRSGEDGYIVSWQKEGSSWIRQKDACVPVHRGEIGIVDVGSAFQIEFPSPVKRSLALIPRQMLDDVAPWLKRSGPLKIEAGAEFTRLICDHLTHLEALHDRGKSQANLLLNNLCNLLAITTTPSGMDQGAVELPTEALLGCCRQNLYSSELSPSMVAARLRISVRTVHSRFQKLGTTFGAWLIEQRLEACRASLQNTMLVQTSISQIAFDKGFREMSHFSKTFKQRFGISPRDFRKASLSVASPGAVGAKRRPRDSNMVR